MTPTMRGFALPTLMVMLALASMATLLAMRNLWVNDQLLNAHADQLRTQHKAETVLPVALADILGEATPPDGTPNLRHTAGNTTQNHAFFPNSMDEYDLLRQRLNTATTPCSAGICAPHTLDAQATKASYWKTQTASAMPMGATDTPDGDHTAWYWVEVFPHKSKANAIAEPLFVYRITAMATGIVPGSTSVLQGLWMRSSDTSLTGQWYSWHVLPD